MLSESKLVIRNLSKSFDKRKVVKDISLTLNQGEIVGLFGPNGAGKTTCFNIIAGLVKANSGKIMLAGKNIINLPIHFRAKFGISYLPQEPSVFRGLSVEDNIKAIAEIWYRDKVEQQLIVDKLLDEFNISHLRKYNCVNLSGGERRRLEIARMLASKPRFVLLDEPLAGIDPIAVSDIKNLIYNLKKRNIGILITDHNVRDSLLIVDKAYVIFKGEVLAQGTAGEIINSKKVREVYLGEKFNI